MKGLKLKIKFVLIFLVNVTLIQAQVTFQKLFGDVQNNVSEFVYDATMDAWGNLYVAGTNITNTFNLAKVDSAGSICWIKTLSEYNAEATHILFSSDSNIVVAGRSGSSPQNSYSFIIKMDTAANVIWSSFIPLDTLGGFINFLEEDQQNNFLLGGNNIRQNSHFAGFLWKVNYSGDFIWYKHIVDTSSIVFSDGISNSNNYLLLGSKITSDLGNADIVLAEIDTNGIVQKAAIFGSGQNDFGEKIIKSGNTFIMACVDDNNSSLTVPHFIQVDSLWNIVQNKKLVTNSSPQTFHMSEFKQNSYLIAADGPMLYVLDSAFNFEQGMNYGISGFNRRIHKAIALPNGQIFAVGTNLPDSDILVFKTDTSLNAGCNSYQTISYSTTVPAILSDTLIFLLQDSILIPVSHDSVIDFSWQQSILCSSTADNILYSNPIPIQVYPNPVTNLVTIENNSNNSPIVRIQLISIDGKVIFKLENIDYRNQSCSINFSAFKIGVYILKVNFSDGLYTNVKIIKI